MPEYDIPLSEIYDEGEGRRAIIEHTVSGSKRLTLVDRTGDAPHDVVQLSRGEVEELAHVILALLNEDNDGTIGYGAAHGVFEAHRSDTDRPEMPESVKFISGGVNEYHCEACGDAWSGYQAEQAATHDCDG